MIWSKDRLSTLREKAIDARRFIEKDWYINTLFLEGKHYVTYDSNTNSLRRVRKSPGQVQRTINAVSRYRDVMSRLITKDDPKIEIRYSGYETINDELRNSIDIVDHLMKEKWRTKHLDALVVNSVRNSLPFGYYANEIFWDSSARDGLGDFSWKEIDPWELWFDPEGKIDLQTGEFDGDFILRRVAVSKEYLMANPKYNKTVIKDLSPSSDFNEVKRNLDSILYENENARKADDALILEIWYVRDESYSPLDSTDTEEDDKEDEPKQKLWKKECEFKIYEVIGNTVIYEEECDLEEYPIKLLKNEITSKVYSRPIISDQIDLNKTVDQVYSSMEEYARTMVHGRILKHEQTKMSAISASSGQIINWDGSRPPQEWQMAGINASLFSFLQEAKQNQMEMARLSDGTLGTGNASSGLELGIRKAADIENASEPTKALSLYLANLIKYILKLYVKHLHTSMPITIGDSGEEKVKKVISKEAVAIPGDTILIQAFDDIEVKIMPSSAFSDLQAEQNILRLAEIGAVDRETLLDTFVKGSTKEILKRVKRAELEAQGVEGEVLDAQMEGQEENTKLLSGKKITDFKKFKSLQAKKAALAINATLLEQLLQQKADPKIIKNVVSHLKESAKAYGVPVSTQSAPQTPQMPVQPQMPVEAPQEQDPGIREQQMTPIQN